jgi:8-oxo-dGTP pyrophosphatase MutT (NUDIX family)
MDSPSDTGTANTFPPRRAPTAASNNRSSERRLRVEQLVSAGGIVYRRRAGPGPADVEIVLCGRTSPLQWSLPKGTPNPGESLEQTALREVREETGLEVRIVAPLGHIEYWFTKDRVRHHKRVYHYLMEPVGGATHLHDVEFDVVDWFPIDQASRVITYKNEAEVVQRARRAVLEDMSDGSPH